VAPWNYRGCSGVPNRLLRSYHSGFTPDLSTVVERMRGYETIALVGFSLGGNLVLKYLGERGGAAPVARAVAFSAPVDLAASSIRMADRDNFLYMMHFMRGLSQKVRIKARRFPLDVRPLRGMRTFREFDGAYTAPLNGFSSAEDYWAKASSKPLLGNIRVPTLLVQAADDPILTPDCFPPAGGTLRVEVTRHGGHVGFYAPGREYGSERRAAEFLEAAR
jgi:predicted alpha/beta-fold hydrolase